MKFKSLFGMLLITGIALLLFGAVYEHAALTHMIDRKFAALLSSSQPLDPQHDFGPSVMPVGDGR